MNRKALFCDGTDSYVIPAEPAQNEAIVLRFRTEKNDATKVSLIVPGKGEYPMEYSFSKGMFDYYEIEWQLGTEMFSYCFQVCGKDDTCYYNRCGTSDTIIEMYHFQIMPGFSTPDWAKGAVMYQIFVDRFYNGDPSNDVKNREYIYIGAPCEKVENWMSPPSAWM